MGIDELRTNWYYFLSLDKDLDNTALYIEPSGQEDTHSFEFYKLIMLGCAEAESLFKQLCKAIDPESSCGNMGEYKEKILGKYPKIVKASIYVPRWGGREIFPFDGWDQGKLSWWDAYQDVKHKRFQSIACATYRNTVYVLGAVYLLNYYLFEIFGVDKHNDSKCLSSKYSPQTLLCQAPEKLPDFEAVGNKERPIL